VTNFEDIARLLNLDQFQLNLAGITVTYENE